MSSEKFIKNMDGNRSHPSSSGATSKLVSDSVSDNSPSHSSSSSNARCAESSGDKQIKEYRSESSAEGNPGPLRKRRLGFEFLKPVCVLFFCTLCEEFCLGKIGIEQHLQTCSHCVKLKEHLKEDAVNERKRQLKLAIFHEENEKQNEKKEPSEKDRLKHLTFKMRI